MYGRNGMILVHGNKIFYCPVTNFPLALRFCRINDTFFYKLKGFGKVIHTNNMNLACFAGSFHRTCGTNGVGCITSENSYEITIGLKCIFGQFNCFLKIIIVRALKYDRYTGIFCNRLFKAFHSANMVWSCQRATQDADLAFIIYQFS